MDMDGYLFPLAFAATPRPSKSQKLTRTPALSRPRRTESASSTSTASTSSIPSPKLVTPQFARSYDGPPPLEVRSGGKTSVGDVFRADEQDQYRLAMDLTRVLSLTPQPTQSSFTPFPMCDSPVTSTVESARPDDSPILRPAVDWTLPPIPKHGLIRSSPSSESLILGGRSRRTSMHSDSTVNITLPECPTAGPNGCDVVKTKPGNGSSNHAHRHSTDSSIISLISSGSSERSLQSDLSYPPSIPGRTSSRKRPTLPSRVSSLKPSTPVVRFAPSLAPTRRLSTSSVVSAESVLDPYPVLPSSTPVSPSTPHSPGRKQLRASSFSSTPLSPIASSPIDFSAIPFTGLDEHERHHTLHRTSSSPHLRSWRITSDMPSSSLRFDRAPRTPKSATSSRAPQIDFSASPTSPPPRPRRPSLFSIDGLTSPKPSPSAIEHIAHSRQPSKGSQEFTFALPNSPSARAVVRVRPAAQTRRHFKPADDIYAEVKKADKLKKLISRAGENEASEAIREAEAWSWARPPPREGRLVKFAAVEKEDTKGHWRHLSGGSYRSGIESDMGLSESTSFGTISEEAAVVTPSNSSAFLSVPLPTVVDPTTPTATHGPLSAETDITPKGAVRAGSGTSILRRTTSQTGAESSLPQPTARPAMAKKSMSDLGARKEKESLGKAMGKGSVGKSGGKGGKKGWSFLPDLGAMGAAHLM